MAKQTVKQKKGKTTRIPSRLSDRKLNKYRKLLENKKTETIESSDYFNEVTSVADKDQGGGNGYSDHMAELGSDAHRMQKNFQLFERTKKFLQSIDEALIRIDNGTFGICQVTGLPIPDARLEAVLTAKSIIIQGKKIKRDEETGKIETIDGRKIVCNGIQVLRNGNNKLMTIDGTQVKDPLSLAIK